ncbi:MAG: sialidase family protein [Bacteroidales bacterium]|jgi:Neuraminidase (sialidase)|nr:sialidase family protein [Bacteroidales bacterium]
MIRSVIISLIILSMMPADASAQPGTAYHGQQIFISGRDGYHTYRIPSIAVTTKGTVLAVCEGRKGSSGNSGDIDLLLKRSEDHGKTWQLGGRTPEHQVNECEAVELTGGRIMLNMRNYDPSMRYRQTAISDDGGVTWYDQKFDTILIEPICQATLERYDKPGEKDDAIILFSNPASRDSRINMTLRASKDEGKTWPVSKLLHPGPSAYSDMAVMVNGNIAIFYEAGTENPHESIIFTQIQIESIKND